MTNPTLMKYYVPIRHGLISRYSWIRYLRNIMFIYFFCVCVLSQLVG
uniref:Uncharacterized protein n=1 Tax=Lepeophtheirus salmonis TaxID=72036 RepID=A0A0K2UC74_LEPSM